MTNPQDREILVKGLETLGCGEILPGLEAYLQELKLWNTRYGLVNAAGDRELVVKHLLDSLAPLGLFRSWQPATLADIGSGAGLPGIPLSFGLGKTQVTLVEKQAKRVRFLENVRLMLPLENVEVCNQGFESLDRRFDLVLFRAFTPLTPEMMIPLLSLVAPGGRLVAYKGRRETLEGELEGLKSMDLFPQVVPLQVPFLGDERHLVVFSP